MATNTATQCSCAFGWQISSRNTTLYSTS